MTRTALLCAVAFLALASPALAGEGGWDEQGWGEGVEVMADADLETQRGGFAIGGLDINFGAVITTFVNGAPALTTQLTWTNAGPLIEQSVGAAATGASALNPDQLAALGLGASGHAGGVAVEDDTGVTDIVHNITEGALQNIIINTASGRDIAQQIDVTLELPGFDLVQAGIVTERFGIRVADDLNGVMFYDPGG